MNTIGFPFRDRMTNRSTWHLSPTGASRTQSPNLPGNRVIGKAINNVDPNDIPQNATYYKLLHLFAKIKMLRDRNYFEKCNPCLFKWPPEVIASVWMEDSISK